MKLSDFKLLDFGHTIQIGGIVFVSPIGLLVAHLPEEEPFNLSDDKGNSVVSTLDLSISDWEKIIEQSDLLNVEVLQGIKKAVVRKSQRQIDQSISWAVFRRDGYVCRYCGRNDVPLTVDHIILWEEGGPSIQDNLISSCKPCNRRRGNMQYGDWLNSEKYKQKIKPHLHAENIRVLVRLPELQKLAKGTAQKSR